MNNETLLVSVVMITYGHEKFIEQAINGVLMQECSFDFELIVANDCSPDNSDTIIQSIIDNHPKGSKLKYVRHNKNIGMMPNFIFSLNMAEGNYIALCEGDDYWTDSLKLQKQVDFLENNMQYIMSFHKVEILKRDNSIVGDFLTTVPTYFEDRDTLLEKGNYIHTPSVMFKNNIIEIPEIINQSPIGDFLLYVLLTKHGKIGYIKEVMAVYRHDVGVLSRSKDNAFKNVLKMNLILLKIVDDERDLKIVINRIIDLVMNNYMALPLNILNANIRNLPSRILKKFLLKK